MGTLEIPVINRISGFESDLNPSFVSRVSNLVGVEEIFVNCSLWTGGALILAILATFSGLINRIKIVIFRFWGQQRLLDSEHFFRPLVYDEEDDTCSSSSSDDEDELPNSVPFENRRPFGVDFRVADSENYNEDQWERLTLRRRFSWSDFASGKSVVKLWDGFGIGLGLKIEGSSRESVVSMGDLNNGGVMGSVHAGGWCQIPAVSRSALPMILTAEVEDSEKVALRVWDGRVGRQIPVISAEFRPHRRRTVAVDSDPVEIYATHESSSVTVRDIRKIDNAMESDGETWWDADAVIVSASDNEGCVEVEEESPVKLRGSVVSRWPNAVKSHLF